MRIGGTPWDEAVWRAIDGATVLQQGSHVPGSRGSRRSESRIYAEPQEPNKPHEPHSHTSHANHTSHMRDTGSFRLTISKQSMGGQYRNHELHEPHEPHSHTKHTNHTSDMNHTSFLEGQYRNRTRGDNTGPTSHTSHTSIFEGTIPEPPSGGQYAL